MSAPLKALRLLACVLTLSAAAGCGNPCMDLANQICNCQPDPNTQAICQQQAQEAESTFNVRSQDEQFCQQQLDKNACDCTKLNTPEGRRNCGLVLNPAP